MKRTVFVHTHFLALHRAVPHFFARRAGFLYFDALIYSASSAFASWSSPSLRRRPLLRQVCNSWSIAFLEYRAPILALWNISLSLESAPSFFDPLVSWLRTERQSFVRFRRRSVGAPATRRVYSRGCCHWLLSFDVRSAVSIALLLRWFAFRSRPPRKAE